ncbi:MAG TPA: zf-HC2 domain-containing protein [Thermoanaerobaculia bacterium]|nr:zf-HC2 domain-containing protein [Thermoanaerobaculia bacterium]
MEESSSDFRDTLLELIDASPEPMDHPSPDQWIAYQRGELSADEEARLQEHLVRCRDCFDLAAAAAAFAEPDGEPDASQEMETAALWRLLRPQLDPPPQNVRNIADGPRRPSRGFRLPTRLAATFFVALIGMTVWSLQQWSALKAAQAAQANAPIFDFIASQRGPAGQERTLPTGPQMLVFHPDPSEQLPVYRLTIRDAATGRKSSSHELRLNRDLLALTLYLPEGLPPGRYRLELADTPGKILETYLLRVTAPE